MKYLDILMKECPLSIENYKLIKKYVEVFRYESDIC